MLTLTMLRCPDAVPPQARTVAGGEFSIGRGAENDWVLPDPERLLSRRHCGLAYRSGGWQVADFSANGTFLNREPIGSGQSREVRDGDRLRFGEYELEVRIAETATPRRATAARDDLFSLDPCPPHAGPLYEDSLLRGGPEQSPFVPALGPPPIKLPPDYDPLAPEAGETPFAGPTQPDHSPHLEDAIRPALPRALLPDDWDRDPASSPPTSPMRAPTLEEEEPAPILAPHPAPAPATAHASPSPTGKLGAIPTDDLFLAFLRGVGLRDAQPSDPVAAMEALGAAFRAVVSGLRLALIARAAIKGEFRIEQTIIRSRGNNPLKFSADDDDALLALLGAGRRTEMGATEAVAEALRDMRLHEVATIAAMRSAVRALLARFDPAKLRVAADQGGLNLVPVQRKARAWDAFEALYTQTNQALIDDFDAVFGKAFARAYERALDEASAKEPRG
jgi:type VI secretion system protein ImpI/type VI secretion system protein